MHNIMSQLMGISVLKPVLRNIEKSLRNRRKTTEKLPQKRKLNLKKIHTMNIFKLILVSIKKPNISQKFDFENTVYVPRY